MDSDRPEDKRSSSIRGKEKHVGELFTESFYQVPAFQREYAWEADVHFVAMLGDLLGQYDPDPRNWDEYFLGNLVMWEDGNRMQLIDGQQRMTSLAILLAAIRDRFDCLGEKESAETVNALLRATRSELDPRTGRWVKILDPRIELLYEDSKDALKDLIEGRAPERLKNDPESTSVNNILESYREAVNFIEGNLADHNDLYGFLEYLKTMVTLVHVQAPDDRHAISIFWTMNDRGRQLDAMELLKNLLFASTKRKKEWASLAAKWKDIRTVLEEAEVTKPVQFLRYAVLSSYNAGRDDKDWRLTKEENIHRWMKNNSAKLRIVEDPIAYADTLLAVANRYKNLRKDKRPNGTDSPVLANFKKFSKGMRQHYIVLLAAHELPNEEFDRVATALENLLFVILFTGSITREVEREFTKWAEAVRNAASLGGKQEVSSAIDTFIETQIRPELQKRASSFDVRFRTASPADITETRYKYAVAKIAQYVESLCHASRRKGDPAPHEQLTYFINKSHDLEHIMPKALTEEWKAQFGSDEDRAVITEYVWRFGNLTYLESTINTAIKQSLFGQKRKAFGQSKFELTKALAKPPCGSARRQAAAELLKYDYEGQSTWTRSDIDERSEVMLELAHGVWDLGPVSRPA